MPCWHSKKVTAWSALQPVGSPFPRLDLYAARRPDATLTALTLLNRAYPSTK